MSKERELLREIIKSSYFIGYRLLGKVEKLLAQPEPEPVAWMVETSFNGKTISEFHRVKPTTRTYKYCKVTELYETRT